MIWPWVVRTWIAKRVDFGDQAKIGVLKTTAQLELASFYEGRQKPDEAKRIYDQIQKENPGTEDASLAQQRAAKLK